VTHDGGSGDWAERPPRRRSGRHSRAPQDYGDPGAYAAPDPYAQADPYPAAGPHAQADPYPAGGSHAPGGYGQADLYPPADSGAWPRPYGGQQGSGAHAGGNGQEGRGRRARPANPDPYARSGPDAATGPYGRTDPSYGRPLGSDPLRGGSSPGGRGSLPGRDPRLGQGSAGPFPGRDPLAGRDSFPGRDPLTPADPRRGRTGPQPSGQYPPGDGYAPREHYGPPGNGAGTEAYGPPGGYPAGAHGGRGPGRQDRYGQPAGYGEQNGYGPAGAYGRPDRSGTAAYGRRRDARGPGDEGDAAPRAAGDRGPFRWQPSPMQGEGELGGGPQGTPAPPGYGGMDQQRAGPGPGTWDPGRETGRRRGRDDTEAAAAQPGRGPAGEGAWEDDADEPGEWTDAPARDGLIPGFGDRQDFRRGRSRRPGRRVGRALAPTVAMLVALVVLVALGFGGYKIYQHFQSPDYSGPGFGEVTVQVNPGDTAESLGPRLVQAGVVASTSSFVSAVKQSSCPTCLEPGFFRLHKHMNSALAYKLLLNPTSRIQSVVVIPEGLRLTQILARLKAVKSPIPASAYAKALKDTAALGLPSYAKGNPEGYLFPATYAITPGMNATSVLQAMVTRFDQEATSVNLPAAAAAIHLSPGQVITVASLLQAEGGSSKYFSLVAEVIYNRLRAGWKLGLQSTVNYALHINKATGLTVTQLNVPSPYNTYIHTGLPPGPIDSPGDAAIQAALHPAHGNYMYFVTVDKTGLTKFTSSAAVFAELEAECRRNGVC